MLPVKWISNDMGGVPALTGIAGSMIAILDAFLVNGFNSKSATVTGDGSFLTITAGASHGFVKNQVIELSGANQAALNGQFRVYSTDATSVKVLNTFNGTASGSITVKSPSVGWEKSFSGTNKAVYRSTDVTGTRLYLRVDDTNTKYALVRGYERMSDVDTGVGAFPTLTQVPASIFWMKSVTADSTARAFRLIADSRMLYLFIDFNISISSHISSEFMVFGDFNSYKANDAYGCILGGGYQLASTQHEFSSTITSQGGGSYPVYIARSYSQVGYAVTSSSYGNRISNYPGYISITAANLALPSPLDNGIILDSGWFIYEIAAAVIRGRWAGAYYPLQYAPTLADQVFFKGSGENKDKLFVLFGIGISNTPGRIAIDLTGPWR